MKRTILCLLFLAVAASVRAQAPAARAGDLTSHGGQIIGPGVPTVLIAGLPAAVVNDQTVCPLVDGTVPHVGGPIVDGFRDSASSGADRLPAWGTERRERPAGHDHHRSVYRPDRPVTF